MPTSRIVSRFHKVKAEGRAALVAYLMAGDPDLETSYQALCAVRDNGADVIELGAPFTDPMADGPAIQKAALRALANHTQLTDALAPSKRFRQDDQDTQRILMRYANSVHMIGSVTFAAMALDAGPDGLLFV